MTFVKQNVGLLHVLVHCLLIHFSRINFLYIWLRLHVAVSRTSATQGLFKFCVSSIGWISLLRCRLNFCIQICLDTIVIFMVLTLLHSSSEHEYHVVCTVCVVVESRWLTVCTYTYIFMSQHWYAGLWACPSHDFVHRTAYTCNYVALPIWVPHWLRAFYGLCPVHAGPLY